MSWLDRLDRLDVGSGRSSMWMAASQPVFLAFAGTRARTIDRERANVPTASADSSTGPIVTDPEGGPMEAGAFRRHK